MFIAPVPTEATKQITFRSDVEMDATLSQLCSALRTNKSTLVRIAVANLIADARKKRPTHIVQLKNYA